MFDPMNLFFYKNPTPNILTSMPKTTKPFPPSPHTLVSYLMVQSSTPHFLEIPHSLTSSNPTQLSLSKAQLSSTSLPQPSSSSTEFNPTSSSRHVKPHYMVI